MNSRRLTGWLLVATALLLPVFKLVEWFSLPQAATFVFGAYLLLMSYRKPTASAGTPESAAGSPDETGPAPPAAQFAGESRRPRFHLCNVLAGGGERRSLWHLTMSGGAAKLEEHNQGSWSDPLPKPRVARDWRDLWRNRLNLAWLPADHICLRVLHLPATGFAEMLSMVELQLEKLSPLPLGQILWTVEPLKANAENLQTVVVVMVARQQVEEFLGKLETQGFWADRLELPCLHQLLASPAEREGIWVYPLPLENTPLCLVAWWRAGKLCHLNLLPAPASDSEADLFIEQLTQTAWAGEIEGWFDSQALRCTLLAEPANAAAWKSWLERWSGQPVIEATALSPSELAIHNAALELRQETQANLVPLEFRGRYRQQFIDHLWMRGLAALVLVYLAGVGVYLLALQVVSFRTGLVEAQISRVSQSYTNTMLLKARVQALQDRLDLKFAALESWKATALLLPQGLSLTALTFDKGKALTLQGTAPADRINAVADYNQALSRYRVDGTNGPMFFEKVNPYNSSPRGSPSGVPTVAWSFTCELKQNELK